MQFYHICIQLPNISCTTCIIYNYCVIYSDPDYSKRIRKPILTLGKQPESDVFVLSPTVHVNKEGELIPFIDQKYVWVNEIINKECVLPDEYLQIRELPTCEWPLRSLLEGLQKLTQANFPSAL